MQFIQFMGVTLHRQPIWAKYTKKCFEYYDKENEDYEERKP